MDEYEDYEEYETGRSVVNKILIGIIIVLVIAVGVIGFFLVRNLLQKKETKMGYALTQEDLDAAMEEIRANSHAGDVALMYENDAYSDDGRTFTCYIMNSPYNTNDMFLTIYADENRTDKLFTSGLVPPGKGFNQIKLDRALTEEDNIVYVVLSLVETNEDGVQSVVGESAHTMDFWIN